MQPTEVRRRLREVGSRCEGSESHKLRDHDWDEAEGVHHVTAELAAFRLAHGGASYAGKSHWDALHGEALVADHPAAAAAAPKDVLLGDAIDGPGNRRGFPERPRPAYNNIIYAYD